MTSWSLRWSVCGLVQVVVLWVGTNNYEHTAEQVAGGILAIVELLISCLPKAKIVVLVSGAVCYGSTLHSPKKKKTETGSHNYDFMRYYVTHLHRADRSLCISCIQTKSFLQGYVECVVLFI